MGLRRENARLLLEAMPKKPWFELQQAFRPFGEAAGYRDAILLGNPRRCAAIGDCSAIKTTLASYKFPAWKWQDLAMLNCLRPRNGIA